MNNKSMGIAAVVAVAAVAAGIWWYTQGQAEEEVERSLAKADLIDVIEYDSVSYNPLTGSVRINQPRLVGDNEALPDVEHSVDALTFYEMEEQDGIPIRFHARLSGLKVNVLELARTAPTNWQWSKTKTPDNLSHWLLMLGYDDLEVDLEVNLAYDRKEKTLALTVDQDAPGIAGSRIEIELANVSERLFRLKEQMAGSAMALAGLGGIQQMLGPVMEDASKIEIVRVRGAYNDQSYLKRLKEFARIASYELPSRGGADAAADELVEKTRSDWKKMGIPDDLIDDFTAKIASFVRDPDYIALSVNPSRPVPIADLIGNSAKSIVVLLKPALET